MSDRNPHIEAALSGLFVANALSMPAHWYYNRDNIRTDFDGGITGSEDPPHPHPEAFMVGMCYFPDLDAAKKLGGHTIRCTNTESSITHPGPTRMWNATLEKPNMEMPSQQQKSGITITTG